MAKDLFNNNATTTVTSGGTTAPAQGTTQTWTVASSSSFPAASNSSSPATQFYVCDPALSTELILVTNVSGSTWSVTRGADGTTPVAHTSGFTVRQIVPAAFLNKIETQDDGVFNVKLYGALGDASTDDTSAFNACISAAETYAASNGMAKVVVPPDSYKINGPVTVKGDITYDFRGAYIFNGNTFSSSGSGWHMFNYTAASGYAGESNVTVLGGVFDAKGQNAATWTSGGDIAKNIFLIGDGRNYRFESCTFRNVPSYHALDVNGIDGLVVNNCRFEGFTDNNSPSRRSNSEAIQLENGTGGSPCKNVKVTNCYMGPAVDGSGLGGFGRLVGSHTDTNGTYLSNIVVTGNTIESPLSHGVGFYSVTDSVIANNVITGAGKDGIKLTAGNTSSTNQNFNVTIANNIIRDCTLAGINLEASKKCVVTGNFIYDTDQQGINLSKPPTGSDNPGGNAQPCPDNIITNNTIIGVCRSAGTLGAINISGDNNTKNYIVGNSFRQYGSGTEAAAPIRIEGTGAGNNYFVGNIFGQDWFANYDSNIVTSNAAFWDNERWHTKVKTADQAVTSGTLTDATDLVFRADGNAVYEIEFCIRFSTNATGTLFRSSWTVPASTTGIRLITSPTNNTATFTGNQDTNARFEGRSYTSNMDTAGAGNSNVDQLILERTILTTSSTAGNVQYQFCNVNATTATLKTGSYVRWRKLEA